jgi:hypothetical protein
LHQIPRRILSQVRFSATLGIQDSRGPFSSLLARFEQYSNVKRSTKAIHLKSNYLFTHSALALVSQSPTPSGNLTLVSKKIRRIEIQHSALLQKATSAKTSGQKRNENEFTDFLDIQAAAGTRIPLWRKVRRFSENIPTMLTRIWLDLTSRTFPT